MGWPQAILLAVAVQRLIELWWSRRNERRLRAAGAIEIGARHYPLFILLHGGWLLAVFLGVPPDAPLIWPLLVLFLLLQAARVWVIVSLGRYWTTRVLSLPQAPLVRTGPYRLLRHPNYLIVALEIPLLPLAFGAWRLAFLFGTLNLLLLAYRIAVEERALRPRRALSG